MENTRKINLKFNLVLVVVLVLESKGLYHIDNYDLGLLRSVASKAGKRDKTNKEKIVVMVST